MVTRAVEVATVIGNRGNLPRSRYPPGTPEFYGTNAVRKMTRLRGLFHASLGRFSFIRAISLLLDDKFLND